MPYRRWNNQYLVIEHIEEYCQLYWSDSCNNWRWIFLLIFGSLLLIFNAHVGAILVIIESVLMISK